MKDPLRNLPGRSEKPKRVSSLRHGEENLAKVAGFTEDSAQQEMGPRDLDGWEFWRQNHEKHVEEKETWGRPLFVILGLVTLIGVSISIWKISLGGASLATLDQRTTRNNQLLPTTIGLQSEEIARHFLEAETLEEQLKWTRSPERVAPLMRQYYANSDGLKNRGETLSLRRMGTVLVKNGFVYERYHVSTATGDRLLAVCETSEGRLVDWECYARFNSVPWIAFLNNPTGAAPPEFRVFYSRTDFYTNINSDSHAQFFRIESPDLDSEIYAFVKDDLKLAALLNQNLSRSISRTNSSFLSTGPDVTTVDRKQRAILSLRHVSRINQGHLVEIVGMKHMGWVTPD